MGGGAGGRRVPAETLLSQHNDLKIIGPSLSVASLQMSTPRAGHDLHIQRPRPVHLGERLASKEKSEIKRESPF